MSEDNEEKTDKRRKTGGEKEDKHRVQKKNSQEPEHKALKQYSKH